MPDPTRCVLVTGAAAGIGAAIVRQCVTKGYSVVGTDIDVEALAERRAELPQLETEVLDVTAAEEWERVVNDVERRVGPIDVLINNAGVCSPGRSDQVSLAEDRLTVEVNLMGVIHGVRTLLPRFLDRQRGHVINVASMAAFAPAPDLASYCTTKHAVRAYTHSCALDHRHTPVQWTLVCPSAVETPMLERMRRKRAGVVVITEKPMTAETFALSVVDAIESPQREVLVPALRGKLIRFLGLFPGLVARGMDGAEKRGFAALDRE